MLHSSSARDLRRRRAFSLIELLIVVSIIGLMIGLLLPAVQQTREAANRIVCANNLRQLGLAVHHYHTQFDSLPPSRLGKQHATWLVPLLPFIEQDNLYRQWRLAQTYYEQSDEARLGLWKGFFCPTRRSLGGTVISIAGDEPSSGSTNPTHVPGALSDYAANVGTKGDWF